MVEVLLVLQCESPSTVRTPGTVVRDLAAFAEL